VLVRPRCLGRAHTWVPIVWQSPGPQMGDGAQTGRAPRLRGRFPARTHTPRSPVMVAGRCCVFRALRTPQAGRCDTSDSSNAEGSETSDDRYRIDRFTAEPEDAGSAPPPRPGHPGVAGCCRVLALPVPGRFRFVQARRDVDRLDPGPSPGVLCPTARAGPKGRDSGVPAPAATGPGGVPDGSEHPRSHLPRQRTCAGATGQDASRLSAYLGDNRRRRQASDRRRACP